MQVRSTRGGAAAPLLDALEEGLAPDGGLYLPVSGPVLPSPPHTLGDRVADTASWAAPILLEGLLPRAELEAVARKALDFPVPLTRLDGRIGLLELFHGPTLAFKDVGARFLARLWSRVHRDAPRTVLVATSGDTGGAVAQACYGLPGVRVAVLFPDGRVSEVQRRQFTTLGGNVVAIAVDGPFDRCQELVKDALADARVRAEYGLTSANSINLGRLLPQVFYYLHLARIQGWGRGGASRTPVIIPSGNLGNVTAGVMARLAGAPLGPLVAALNENNVLSLYCVDGKTREAPVLRTLSTAMDVGRPSNLERLDSLFGRDPVRLGTELPSVSIGDRELEETIRWAWRDHGIHLDPHHPAKFPEVVRQASGSPVPPHPRLAATAGLPEVIVPLSGGVGALLDTLRSAFSGAPSEAP